MRCTFQKVENFAPAKNKLPNENQFVAAKAAFYARNEVFLSYFRNFEKFSDELKSGLRTVAPLRQTSSMVQFPPLSPCMAIV